jgi:hypothetical protein
MTANRGPVGWIAVPANGQNRRISLVPVRPSEGPLTEPTPAVRPCRGERVFVPHTCHSQYQSGIGSASKKLPSVVGGAPQPVALTVSLWDRQQCQTRILLSGLVNDLVGTGEDRRRDGKAERSRGI